MPASYLGILMIYNSLVRPYFEYCMLRSGGRVWGCSKASDLKVLFFKLQKMCVNQDATFRGLAIGPTLDGVDPLFASNKIVPEGSGRKIEDLVKYKLLTLAHQATSFSQAFSAPRLPPPPPPWLICSAFQNLPIETYFLSSHSMALFLELTTQQLGFPSFGVWKTWK